MVKFTTISVTMEKRENRYVLVTAPVPGHELFNPEMKSVYLLLFMRVLVNAGQINRIIKLLSFEQYAPREILGKGNTSKSITANERMNANQ